LAVLLPKASSVGVVSITGRNVRTKCDASEKSGAVSRFGYRAATDEFAGGALSSKPKNPGAVPTFPPGKRETGGLAPIFL
jgi:hypothetical protein